MSVPLDTVTLWSIKALSRMWDGIFIGVVPFGIDRNACNYNKFGWYFDCCQSKLCSGPPHNYNYKEYEPMKEKREYVRTGDSVGVMIDTEKGNFSFALDGANLGVVCERISLSYLVLF